MAEAPHLETRLSAVLMMDVAAYSRLMSLDEVTTHRRTRAKLQGFVEPAITAVGGRIVKRTGDGALAEFPDARAAIHCAADIQRHNEAEEAAQPPDRRIRFRMGITLGHIIVESEDIYGESVNIAARLESIAEVGGIYLSEGAAMAGQDEGLVFLDLGLKSLKNIPRPIRAYKVALHGETERSDRAVGASLVQGFGERPAVAVLPFRTDPGDEAQAQLADGITEDIITALARWRSFPVIARASVFAFKGSDADLGFIGQQLGARYVQEGKLRRTGSRLRATVHLTDVEAGDILVTEQFEYDIEDVFALHDEIVRTIVGAIEPELLRHERERAMRAPVQSATAYELLQRGLWHHYRYTPEDSRMARAFFRNALAVDPAYAQAAAALSVCLGHAAQARYEDDQKPLFAEQRKLALQAVTADPRNPQARFARGYSLYHSGEIRPALDELQEAVRLNPSDAAAHANLAFVYNYLNRAADARAAVELALRLSPQDPRRFIWLPALAGSHYLAGDYTAALRVGHEALTANPRYLPVVRYLVASLGQLGQADAAKTVLPVLRKLDGDLAGTRAHLRDYYVAPAVELIIEGLAKAGFD